MVMLEVSNCCATMPSRLGDRAADAGTRVSVENHDGMQHVFQANPTCRSTRPLARSAN